MLLTASDLCTNPSLLEGKTVRLAGGGFAWVDAERISWNGAERVDHLVRLTRIAQTAAGPKVVHQLVNPNQPVTLAVAAHG